MKTIKNLCMILAVSLTQFICTTTAYADCNIGSSVFTLDAGEADFRGVQVSAGCFYKGIVGARATYMLGAHDETLNGLKIELEDMYSFDAILRLPVSDSFYPYVTMGNTWVEVETSYQGYSANFEDDFTTYGAGLHVDILEDVGFNFEYKRIDDADQLMFELVTQF